MNTIDEGNILFAWITSNEPVCIEGWSKFSVPIWSPWESNLTRRRSGCQLGLFSINFDFRNVIFQSMVFPSRLGEVQMKICKGSLQAPFPLPLVASPLARASSRDLFHSPKQESLLAGIVVHAHKSRTRKETRAIERGGQRKRSVLEARINLQKKKDRVLIKDLIQGQPTSSFGKYLFGRRFET